MFRFASPQYFYLFAVIGLLLVLYVLAIYTRKRRLARFGNPKLIEQLMPEVSTRRVRNKSLIYLLALCFVVVALARPQFGAKLKEVEEVGYELMLVVDVSNSMLATDFAPNRLERTKQAINKVLETIDNDRVGLIVFAGEPYMQLPITSDFKTARSSVNMISTSMVTKQGTALGAAIEMATGAFSPESEGSRVMVVVSDGENHEDDATAAARRAAEHGITIYAIGVGTQEGEPIPWGNDFIRDETGTMVVTKLDEEALEKVALVTGGAYVRSTNRSLGLDEIIVKINETQRGKLKTSQYEVYNEKYRYPLAIALLLLLLEGVIIPRKNRILGRFNIFSARDAK